MRTYQTVELEDWEEAFLSWDDADFWTPANITALWEGDPIAVDRARSSLDTSKLDSENQYARDAFQAGWLACEKAAAERTRLEDQANAH